MTKHEPWSVCAMRSQCLLLFLSVVTTHSSSWKPILGKFFKITSLIAEERYLRDHTEVWRKVAERQSDGDTPMARMVHTQHEWTPIHSSTLGVLVCPGPHRVCKASSQSPEADSTLSCPWQQGQVRQKREWPDSPGQSPAQRWTGTCLTRSPPSKPLREHVTPPKSILFREDAPWKAAHGVSVRILPWAQKPNLTRSQATRPQPPRC